MALEGSPIEKYKEFDNVKRVEKLLKDHNFMDLFSAPHSSYTYTGFLQAVGKFPKFCGETDLSMVKSELKYSVDQTCLRELATFFAHISSTTEGLL